MTAQAFFGAYNGNDTPLSDNVFTPEQKDLARTYENIVLGQPHPTSVEFLLPKYSVSTGNESATVSQARMYFTKPADKSQSELLEALPGVSISSTSSYVGFLLNQVSESHNEKVQTIPLRGDNYVATFYGKSPTTYQFSGILYNTRNAAFRELFSYFYDMIFRGTKAAKGRYLFQIVYDNKIVNGWITNMSQSLSATNEMMSQFSFNMLVKDEITLTPTSELNYNNAYWTGDTTAFLRNDSSLDPIPEFNDYLNTARVKPPPRPRIPTGSRRANCRVNRARLNNRGGSTSNRGGNRRQTSQSSPVIGNCDISQAVLEAKRGLDAEAAKINRETENKPLERQQRLTALYTSSAYVRDIRQAYAADPAQFTNQSEKTRLSNLRQQFPDADRLIDAENFSLADVNSSIGPLDNATETSTPAPTAPPASPAANDSPQEQP